MGASWISDSKPTNTGVEWKGDLTFTDATLKKIYMKDLEEGKYLRGSKSRFRVDAIFMHNPVGFLSSGSSPSIKHQCFFHPNQLRCDAVEDLFIFSCGLPISCVCCSICSHTSRVFPIPKTKEIPFLFSHFRLPWLTEYITKN